MSRNFGIPTVTSRQMSGAQPSTGSHYARGRRDSNSLAGESPSNLAIIRGGSFLSKRELNPVQKLDAVFDHREFAAYFFVTVFGISIGVLLAIGVALLDWS
jgi:hypothetical protein